LVPVHNAEIAQIFNEYADLLEIQGANQFRVRAYRTAARNIADLSQSLADMVTQGEDLSQLPGIGKDLSAKLADIVISGRLPQLEELEKEVPAGLLDLTRLAGLGPKRIGALYRELGITSLEQLETAAREQRIRELPGFGAKTEQTILAEIKRKGGLRAEKRLKLASAQRLARPLLDYLQKARGVKRVEAAGSYRRRKETVGDLDILVTSSQGSAVMERLAEYEAVARVISQGSTRSTVVLRFGLQVDVRAVPEEDYGAALHYFTGSKAHTVAIRKMGVSKGLKINEYGVFRGEKRVAGRTEEEVYAQVGLPYIEPELREDRGEIEAAQKGELPELVKLEDIRGDLHAHTRATEGRASLEEMARAAKERGYEYLAITDHSKRLSMTHGLDEKRLAEQIRQIDRLNGKLDGLVILKGIEVDIMEDGSLDLADDILKELDLLVCSVHHKFNLPQDKQTERIIRAISHRPTFTILGHPTGRLLGEREPYDIDMEKVMKAAKECGCVLEVNAQPERLDLNDIHSKMARDMGVMVAISTDAHSVNDLDFMPFGVYQARRGWLGPGDVLNTRGWKELKKLLRR
jgi:DNA polymerase (family 10)